MYIVPVEKIHIHVYIYIYIYLPILYRMIMYDIYTYRKYTYINMNLHSVISYPYTSTHPYVSTTSFPWISRYFILVRHRQPCEGRWNHWGWFLLGEPGNLLVDGDVLMQFLMIPQGVGNESAQLLSWQLEKGLWVNLESIWTYFVCLMRLYGGRRPALMSTGIIVFR